MIRGLAPIRYIYIYIYSMYIFGLVFSSLKPISFIPTGFQGALFEASKQLTFFGLGLDTSTDNCGQSSMVIHESPRVVVINGQRK